MKRLILIAGLVAAVVTSFAVPSASGQAAKPVDDKSLGLAKGSVFDDPTPQPFTLDGKGSGGAAKAAYAAPPLASHDVDEYLPISVDKNECLRCHDKVGGTGRKQAAAIPAGHYGKPVDGKTRVSGDYYNCMLCHASSADVKDLVSNDAPKPAR